MVQNLTDSRFYIDAGAGPASDNSTGWRAYAAPATFPAGTAFTGSATFSLVAGFISASELMEETITQTDTEIDGRERTVNVGRRGTPVNVVLNYNEADFTTSGRGQFLINAAQGAIGDGPAPNGAERNWAITEAHPNGDHIFWRGPITSFGMEPIGVENLKMINFTIAVNSPIVRIPKTS